MNKTEKELKEEYSYIYKKEKIVFPKINGSVIDPVTSIRYVPSLKEDRILIKKTRSLMSLIDIYRPDLAIKWRKYNDYNFREKIKIKAHAMLRKNNTSGFEILMKAWWGEDEIIFNTKELISIYKMVSFKEYMDDAILNFIYLKNKYGGWNNISYLQNMNRSGKITEQDWENYFARLIVKYNVNVNRKNFTIRFP